MRRPVGIVVSIAHYRATVHYTDCPGYRQSVHRTLSLPRTIKVRLCSCCRPSEDDIRAAPPEVSWYAYSPTAAEGRRRSRKAKVVHMPAEMADNLAAQRSLGYGKVPAREARWST